jgi:multidrug resistance efflux pump
MNQQNIDIKKQNIFSTPWVQSVTGMIAIFSLLGIFIYWQLERRNILVENAQIEAPIITLSPLTPGTLNALYVHEGDTISANTPVALVGTNVITSKVGGIVIAVDNSLGKTFSSSQSVVSIINPDDLRVVGAVEETKGLKDIKAGQRATFTVDAFGGKKYMGTVDAVASTSNDTGVVFSISDKRPIKKFNVKIRFSATAYPELKNGMSAKITIFTK